MPRRAIKVFFDGGSRPNPGRMEAAVVVRGVVHLFDNLGIGSNSDAEWLALIHALELAHSLGLAKIELVGDSLSVIGEANDTMTNSKPVHGHAATFRAMANKAPPARIRWIKRQQNLAGIALAARHPR